jgi:hypothetical protein
MRRGSQPLLIKIAAHQVRALPELVGNRIDGNSISSVTSGDIAEWQKMSTLLTEQQADPTGDEQTDR